MMADPLYQLTQVAQAYDGQGVLDVPELVVQRGEILAIIGPSGAGKSTLLRLLNFLGMPTAGQLAFEGQSVAGEPALAIRRRVTTVFQTPALLSRSVTANIAYGLKLRGERLGAAVLREWLTRLGLNGLEKRQPSQLSAGGSAAGGPGAGPGHRPGSALAGRADGQSGPLQCGPDRDNCARGE